MRLRTTSSLKVIQFIESQVIQLYLGIDWKNLRNQQPPIIPEQKIETDTTNFVRLANKITDKEREDFFAFIPRNSNASPDMVVLIWLFSIFVSRL